MEAYGTDRFDGREGREERGKESGYHTQRCCRKATPNSRIKILHDGLLRSAVDSIQALTPKEIAYIRHSESHKQSGSRAPESQPLPLVSQKNRHYIHDVLLLPSQNHVSLLTFVEINKYCNLIILELCLDLEFVKG